MKYSGLAPIRSKGEIYTPFSGINSRKLMHKRVKSETPAKTTKAMGIQCDSMEFLEKTSENMIIIPEIKLSPTFHPQSNQFSFSVLPEPQPFIEKNLNVEKNIFPSTSKDEKILEAANTFKRIEFSKVGDWNETYTLKSKSPTILTNYKGPTIYNNSKLLMRRPYRVTDFSPNLLSHPKKVQDYTLLWQYKSSDKGIFNLSGKLKLQLKSKLNNIRY
jgi:hypothetical protein